MNVDWDLVVKVGVGLGTAGLIVYAAFANQLSYISCVNGGGTPLYDTYYVKSGSILVPTQVYIGCGGT